MSYDIFIYHSDVHKMVTSGIELDECEHREFPADELNHIVTRMIQYGYRIDAHVPECRQYIKEINKCPIQVSVFKNEIAFSVPNWNGNRSAVETALMDSMELSDRAPFALYNPQEDEWTVNPE